MYLFLRGNWEHELIKHFFFFWCIETGSLYIVLANFELYHSNYPQTQSDPPASHSWMLGSQTCTTMPGWTLRYCFKITLVIYLAQTHRINIDIQLCTKDKETSYMLYQNKKYSVCVAKHTSKTIPAPPLHTHRAAALVSVCLWHHPSISKHRIQPIFAMHHTISSHLHS